MRVALLFSGVLTLVPTAAWSQGNPLGPEFRVNTYTTDDQGRPSVAADSAGNFIVVWDSQGGSEKESLIFGQRFASSGTPLGPEFRVNTTTSFGLHTAPAVAADSAGNFVVIWGLWFLDPFSLLGQRFDSSGAPLGSEFDVGAAGGFGPHAASDSAGNFIVVWMEPAYPFPNPPYRVYGRRFASSGAPLGTDFRVNTYQGGSQTGPSVAADSSGNFVVVWTSNQPQDGSGLGVFGQRFASSGAPLGPEFRVNTYTTNSQSYASVAADASGNFVVVWSSLQDRPGFGIFGQRYAASGAALGPEFRVNTYTTTDQSRPSVAADASGNFVVVWASGWQDGSTFGVFGQRYASSGEPLGLEFRVNTYTTGDQVGPSVAADSFGNFVVAWQSFNQDGSAYGVFGQRYRPILPVELMRFRVE